MNGRQSAFRVSGHPVAQFLSMIVLGVFLVGAVIMEEYAIVALLALFAAGYAAFRVRAWWRGLGLGRTGPFHSGPEPDKSARYIEGEYELVEADADATRPNSGTR